MTQPKKEKKNTLIWEGYIGLSNIGPIIITRVIKVKERRRGSKNDVMWWGFPVGPKAKTPHAQCRGPRFDPWSGN